MEIIEPHQESFTIYTKSGCPNCIKVKNLFNTSSIIPLIVDCDEYLIKDRPAFLEFIKKKKHSDSPIFFPIVFNNGSYIGGYNETLSVLTYSDMLW